METLIASLSPSERKILPYLAKQTTVSSIAKKSQLQEIEVLRASQFLSNKEVVELKKTTTETYELSSRGEQAKQEGLPEKKFYDAIPETGISFTELQENAGLEKNEFNIALGTLKKQKAIEIRNGKIFSTGTPNLVNLETLEPKEELLQRGLIEKHTTTDHEILLTALGEKLLKEDLSKDYEERLTSEQLKTGDWKNKTYRHYDVTTQVPAAYPGKKHFVQEAINHIKQLWVEMGFTEMSGTYTQSAYWDLDALFVPQDHPAREMQDTFYLETTATLPKDADKIREVHENGGDTGSEGWNYTYDKREAKKVLLRTHTTALSAQVLQNLDPETDLPAKFFSVNKVFRNETLDWKHLFEFHQVEGIVVGRGLGLQDLIGLQEQFYKKMGFSKVRFRPAYFPYTEPSCEVEAYNQEREEWVELGGMGVFRPEVVKPLLGEDIPVLAWGLGMERIITAYYEIKDLRDIYANDLSDLRTKRTYLSEKE